tara:strand:+ start:201 stop:1205 length:1005 start_codon:yes stop_codon:yes gene_type:complete
MTDIVTIGQGYSLQQRNKLKGMAQEHIIRKSLDLKFMDKALQQILRDEIKSKGIYYLWVKKDFTLKGVKFFKNSIISDSEVKSLAGRHSFVEVITSSEVKKKKPHRVCNQCNLHQYNYWGKDEDNNKKNDGYYIDNKGQLRSFTNICNRRVKDKVNGEEVTFRCCGKFETKYKILIEIEKFYLEEVTQLINLNKRIDSIYFKNNKLYLLESKNKEVSGFGYRDIYSTVPYVEILRNCSKKYKIDSLEFIFNGYKDDNLYSIQSKFEFEYSIDIIFKPVKDVINYEKLKGFCITPEYNKIKKSYDFYYSYKPLNSTLTAYFTIHISKRRIRGIDG